MVRQWLANLMVITIIVKLVRITSPRYTIFERKLDNIKIED